MLLTLRSCGTITNVEIVLQYFYTCLGNHWNLLFNGTYCVRILPVKSIKNKGSGYDKQKYQLFMSTACPEVLLYSKLYGECRLLWFMYRNEWW